MAATKMYLLVEADQSQADPLSRLMTQLVNQLKVTPVKLQDTQQLCSLSSNPAAATACNQAKPSACDKSSNNLVHIKCNESSGDQKPCAEVIVNSGVKSAGIKAEASVDPNGTTQARVFVCPDQRSDQCSKFQPSCEKEDDFPSCGRRNGLDSEQRCTKKFNSYPMKSKIPELSTSEKRKCPKPLMITDRVSNASIESRYSDIYRSKLTPTNIEKMRQGCAKNVPEARLKKYSTCINRNNGLQDWCDPISRIAVKKCCKKEK